MTEREEHEYAAKAAGIEVRWITNAQSAQQLSKMLWTWWSPKTDRADAFSLMVACKMEVWRNQDGQAFARYEKKITATYSVKTSNGFDFEAATRLAIFRVAVEIGKAMK